MSTIRNSRRRRDLASALLGGLVALLLVGLALPATLASFAALPGTAVADSIRRGLALTRDDLDRLIDSRETALAWRDEGKLWHELGLAHLVRSQSWPAERSETRLQDLEAARVALREALMRRPLDSHAWLRLTLTELLLLNREGAARAVAASMRTAPFQPDQFTPRLEFGLLLWDLFHPADRALWEHQVRLAWRSDPQAVAALVARRGHRDRVEAALAIYPEASDGLAGLLAR